MALRLAGLTAVIVHGGAVLAPNALYHRFVTFPGRLERWAALRSERQPVTELSGWKEFRGVFAYTFQLSTTAGALRRDPTGAQRRRIAISSA